MKHRARKAVALAFVAALALTVFVATGSAANVQPKPFGSISHAPAALKLWSHAPAVDVRSTTPDVDVRGHKPTVDVRSTTPDVDVRGHKPAVDVRSTTPDVDVRSHAAPRAAKAWAVKAWAAKAWAAKGWSARAWAGSSS